MVKFMVFRSGCVTLCDFDNLKGILCFGDQLNGLRMGGIGLDQLKHYGYPIDFDNSIKR